MIRHARLLAVLAASILALGTAVAQDAVPTGEKTDRQKAKQARVEEYLRGKEQRLAEKEARRQEKQAQQAAAGAAAAEAGLQTRSSPLPRELALAQDAVRASALGQDPTVQAYLELIDRQEATAYELAAFGNFLADAGLRTEALVYYSVAIDLVRDDPLLWLNLGTLYRQLGELDQASNAYGRVLRLDPNNAMAHYNIGTVLDQQRRYEQAIEAYTVALTLDPTLGDPSKNPQAANNQRLLAVKLMLYQQQMGSQGTSLVEIPQEKIDEARQAPPDRED